MCEEINEKFKLPYGKVHELDGEFGVGKTQVKLVSLENFTSIEDV